jgi:hypothetical protein
MLFFPVYTESHPRRIDAHWDSSKSFNSFSFNGFRTLLLNGAHATLFFSIDSALFLSPWGCIPPLHFPFFRRECAPRAQFSARIALFLAPRWSVRCALTPSFATHTNSVSRKSFICHSYENTGGCVPTLPNLELGSDSPSPSLFEIQFRSA